MTSDFERMPYPSPLEGVSCAPSSSTCSGAGSQESFAPGSPDGDYPAVEQWTGSGEPEGGIINDRYPGILEAVSCYSTQGCVAVGGEELQSNMAIIWAWNGSSWTEQTAALPSDAASSGLESVSCVSANFCTATGSYQTSDDSSFLFVDLWNGSSWKLENLPSASGASSSSLSGVSCTTVSSCVAVGQYKGASGTSNELAYVWSGSNWRLESPADPGNSSSASLAGVSCVSQSDCVAVGSYATASRPSEVLAQSWNGSSWTTQPAVAPGSSSQSSLDAVSCWAVGSTTPCMAVGSYTTSSGATRNLAETSAT